MKSDDTQTMSGNREVRHRMQVDFSTLQGRNPSYSLRAFARKLGLAPSATSEILNGKRKITEKIANRILTRLGAPPDETARILKKLNRSRASDQYSTLDSDHFHVLSDWYCFAILSLAETIDFSSTIDKIAARLGIQKRHAKRAIESLKRLEMLAVDSDNSLVPTGKQLQTHTDVSSASIRKHHFQSLELAKRSLEIDDLHLRDFSSITMAIDPTRLVEAKARIRAFRHDMSEFLESGQKTEVYKLNIQLFPLTHQEKS